MASPKPGTKPSSTEEAKKCTGKLCLKPLTTHNVLFYYAPLQGVLGYTALSINVMNPTLVLRMFPRRDITNVLLANALVGSSLFMYNRPHLSSLSRSEKILYSAFGGISFTLGSVLVWAILRSIVPENVPLCTLCGLGSGFAMIKVGCNYVKHVDSLVAKP